ncbi:MAG TPA: hypothetical protein VFZ65_11385 [Planctomycetota bacterium]|nr:hypothetical protein [Planctomycetota bacterium]
MLRAASATVLLLCTACGRDAAADPSDEHLLAAYPGGSNFESIEHPDLQVDCPVPAFLFGDGTQIATGVAVPTGERNRDGGQPVHRWGLWRYYHVASNHVGDRSTWGHLAQRGEFRDGKRVGEWEFWYPGGSRCAQGGFVDGAMDGPWQVWGTGGDLDAEHSGTYRAGSKVR